MINILSFIKKYLKISKIVYYKLINYYFNVFFASYFILNKIAKTNS